MRKRAVRPLKIPDEKNKRGEKSGTCLFTNWKDTPVAHRRGRSARAALKGRKSAPTDFASGEKERSDFGRKGLREGRENRKGAM